MKLYHLLMLIALITSVFFSTNYTSSQETPLDACADVRYFIANEVVPYAPSTVGGGRVESGSVVDGNLGAGKMADFWVFKASPGTLHVSFGSASDGALALEVGLFAGLTSIGGETDYQTVIAGQPYTYTLPGESIYTLAVQRQHIAGQEPTSYQFSIDYPTSTEPLAAQREVRNLSSGIPIEITLDAGTEKIQFASSNQTAWIQAGGVAQVVTPPGGSQVSLVFDNNASQRLTVGSWAQEFSFLGGHLSAQGTNGGEGSRIFYLEDYGYASRQEMPGLNNFTDSNGTHLNFDWESIKGIWILESCAGVKLQSGQSFVTPLALPRDVSFGGNLESFHIAVNAPDAANVPTLHQFDFSWALVAPQTEASLTQGVFAAQMAGGQLLQLEVPSFNIEAIAPTGEPPPTTESIEITLRSWSPENVTITLDWINLGSLALLRNQEALYEVHFSFLDSVRTGITTRPADGLAQMTALEDIVRIIYQNQEERLMLPESEGFIELITPGGDIPFVPGALPGQPGYQPRSLNNLGGECYQINTLLPEANCPPNGHPNPSNGNLWYAITDHIAYGGGIDLALTRSYNSVDHTIDGPFGQGWISTFLLDYPAAYASEPQNARSIDLRESSSYRVALELTWAPRGLVTLATPSGSRHAFVRIDQPEGSVETWQALTMPHWELTRANVRDFWSLTQDDGLVFEFDRAGRLRRYEYPAASRHFEIEYPWESAINGPGAITGDLVTITDAADHRRLELYYNTDHHIARSVLRDMTKVDPLAFDERLRTALADASNPESINTQCMQTENCFEIVYRYAANQLVEVVYPDGQLAQYGYNEAGYLIEHNDPRAPVAPLMRYVYDEIGRLTAASIDFKGQSLPWRTLEYAPPSSGNLSTTLIKEPLNAAEMPDAALETLIGRHNQTFTYHLVGSDTAWDAGRDNFTLITMTHPLDEVGPTTYEWSSGQITRIIPEPVADVAVRNEIVFSYDAGRLSIMKPEGYTQFFGIESTQSSQVFSLGNSAAMTFHYDEQNRLTSFENDSGAIYEYSWEPEQPVLTVRRANDEQSWAYHYNPVGLVEQVTHWAGDIPGDTPDTIRYTWDSLGRLVEVQDSLGGKYTITYTLGCESLDGICTEVEAYQVITLTDPVGATTWFYFDGQGHLIEHCLSTDLACTTFMRRTSYEYDDPLSRLTAEIHWLAQESQPPELMRTSYTYQEVDVLGPLWQSGPEMQVNGYQITKTDPYGYQDIYIYDALGRISQTQNDSAHIVRYDYRSNTTWRPMNSSLQIVEWEVQTGNLASTTYYYFDKRWQLLYVKRQESSREGGEPEVETWEVFQPPQTTNFSDFAAPALDVAGINWTSYDEHSRPTKIVYNHNSPEVFTPNPVPQLKKTWDFLGRPLQVVKSLKDAANLSLHTLTFAYCPQPDGGERLLRSHPSTEINPSPLSCEDAPQTALAIQYDARGRVVSVEDENGTRWFTYVADPITHTWLVTLTVAANDEADLFNWEFRYDAAGDLVQWVDDSGILRSYTHDTLGRLTRIETPGEPEASFSFAYNAADLLIREENDLGRGTIYDYNARGQIIIQQDISTGAVTTYTYNLTGLLDTITSPLGNTTAYLYEDEHDATRLTALVTSGGTVHQYRWDDVANQLVYTDPRNQETVYSFDGMGVLWHIDSPLPGQTYRLRYDEAGNVLSWTLGDKQSFNLSYNPAAYEISLSERAQPDWHWRFTVNSTGQLIKLGNPADQILGLVYDSLARPRSVTTNDGTTWEVTRTPNQPVIQVNGPDYADTIRFDALYRLIARNGAAYDYTYNEESFDVNLTFYEEGAEGQHVMGTYTNTFTQITERTPLVPAIILQVPGQRITYIYNLEHMLNTITTEVCMDMDFSGSIEQLNACLDEPDAEIWRTTVRIDYNGQGWPVRIFDEERFVETFTYDNAGNLSTYQNNSGITFSYFYDEVNRLQYLIGPTGIKLLPGYDLLNQVVGICQMLEKDPIDTYAECPTENIIEQYQYDSLGRLVSQRFPLSNTATTDQFAAIQYGYNAQSAGLLASWGVGSNLVPINYTQDGKMLPALVGNYAFTYTGIDQLQVAESPSGAVQFVYEQGRTQAVIGQNFTATYQYGSDDWQYQVQGTNGNEAAFTLDPRGFLSAISNPTTADSSLVSFDYLRRGEGQSMIVNINWEDIPRSFLEFNHRDDLLIVGYVLEPHLVYFDNETPNARTNHQQIQSYITDEKYSILTTYDEQGHPLSMRIQDISDGKESQLIYMITFRYDAFGQRLFEKREYQNGTQIYITYNYGGPSYRNQLDSRRVSIVLPPSLTTSSFPLFGLGLFILPAAMIVRRSRRWCSAFLAAVLLVSYGPPMQQSTLVYTFTYSYDNIGNLAQIDSTDVEGLPITCAAFRYDNANRLTAADINYSEEMVTRTYQYDAYNRLSTIDNSSIIYQGSSSVPIMIGQDTIGQVANGPYIFQNSPQGTTWMLHNGSAHVFDELVSPSDEISVEAFWFSDPLGRYLDDTFVQSTDDVQLSPCGILAHSSKESLLTGLHPMFDNMIWDSEANLYFYEGRAYEPEIGRFLQRNPQGPNAIGNVYDYPAHAIIPPISPQEPVFWQGLHILSDAVSKFEITTRLTAGAVNMRYQPTPAGYISNKLVDQFDDSADHLGNIMANYLTLPDWLTQAYNYPDAHIDIQTGSLQISDAHAPGQGIWQDSGDIKINPLLDFSPETLWMPTHVEVASMQLAGLIAQANPPMHQMTTYTFDAWRPEPTSLMDSWQVDRPVFDTANTPSIVQTHLPHTLTAPYNSIPTLDLVTQLMNTHKQTGHGWLSSFFDQTLPSLSALDGLTGDAWRESWFSEDTLGIAEHLNTRWPVPLPMMPVYRLGNNPVWEYLQYDQPVIP